MKILFIGDITGTAGVSFVSSVLPQVTKRHQPDLVVANAENAAASGRGLTRSVAEELYDCGVEIITLGNHVWDQKEIGTVLESDARVIRPANLPDGVPGNGHTVCKAGGHSVAVINLIGRTFMGLSDCPFRAADEVIKELQPLAKHIIVDFHAEATSEKLAMGWYLSGRVSAVFGTHTHVQTADERVLPGGTGYLTDVGMTGPLNGIIGMQREQMIKRFMDQMPARFIVADGPRQFSGVLLTLDEAGKAEKVERIHMVE